MVKNGEFREDLFYRISPFPIDLPALRDRRDDIPLLIDTLLKRLTANPTRSRIDSEALNCLLDYDCPGNIRELKNIVERALLLADGNLITRDELPSNLLKSISERAKPLPMRFDEIIPLGEMEQRY